MMRKGRCVCGSSPVPTAHRLTAGQLRTLIAVAHGRTYREAAFDLGLSEQTVKNHMSDAFDRLDVNSMVGAFHAMGWLRVP